jgi:hypothetical protein
MRFICFYKPGRPERSTAPTAEEQATMGKLIGEMAKAGVLLAAEGCLPSQHGARVRIDAGQYTVTEGPFPETKELIAGMCMLQVKSKAEAIEWTKRFLSAVGEGQSELLQLHETHPRSP